MKIYISSSCSSKSTLPDILHELIEFGFERIELTGNIKYCEGIDKAILKFNEIYGLDFIIHNYFPFLPEEFVLNIASGDPEIKAKTIDHIKRAISLLQKLGKNLYSLHPGFKHDLLPELKDGFFIKANDSPTDKSDFYQMIELIMDHVAPDNFRIAIENLHPRTSSDLYSFLCAPDDIEQFLHYFRGRPNIGILLDLGHLNVAAKRLNFDKYEVLDKLFNNYWDRVFEIHISENDGSDDSHGILELDSWQIEYLEKNRKYLKDIPVTLEWHNKTSEESYERYQSIRDMLEG